MVLEYDAKKPNLLDLIFQPSSEHCVRGREQVGYMVVDKKLQSPGPATCCVPAPASAPQLHRISAAWVSPAHKRKVVFEVVFKMQKCISSHFKPLICNERGSRLLCIAPNTPHMHTTKTPWELYLFG